MKTIRTTYSALISLLAFVSCGQEEMLRSDSTGEDDVIIFRTSLPSVTLTRDEADVNLSNSIHLTAFTLENSTTAGGDNPLVGEDGKLQEHFSQRIEGNGNVFTTPDCKWPRAHGDSEGQLEFFAFYPPLPEDEVLSEDTPTLENTSKVENDVTTINYKLKGFRISKDLSEQVDFVTAHAIGSKKDNRSGVNLEFQHQLSRVELQAWGGNSDYEIEIAGVRIGGVIAKADFNFKGKSENNSIEGSWETSPEQDCVEYIFREGDTVFTINKDQHNTESAAASIMGNVEWGMVIPSEQNAWDHKEDISNMQRGTYFSVLLRVADKVGRLYPYPDNSDNMTVIYFAVSASGEILSRVYPGDKPDTFFIDEDKQQQYETAEGVEIKDFGWAAIPCETSRKAGFQYTYKLDYSIGVGVHDPQDPNPGKPIMFNVKVGDATIEEWTPESLKGEAVSD